MTNFKIGDIIHINKCNNSSAYIIKCRRKFILLADEVQAKAIMFTYKGAAITARIIQELIFRYSKRPEAQTYGKQSIGKLNRKNRPLESIPLAGEDLSGMRRELRRYGVDYAVIARKPDPDTYDIYFKGADISQIQTALRTYARISLQRAQRPTIRERMHYAHEKARQQSTVRTQPQQAISMPQEGR